jgi:hypothetical protein
MERQISPAFASMGRALYELASSYSDQELALVIDFMTRSGAPLAEETRKLREKATSAAIGIEE